LATERDFDGRVLHYQRDRVGRLERSINGAGETIDYQYDPVDNVTGQRATELDGRTVVNHFRYDAAGRLISADNADSRLVFDRDGLGRITGETCNDRTVRSVYDQAGRRIRRTTPSGTDSLWQFDSAGLPRVLNTVVRGGEPHGLRFSHDAAGREIRRSMDQIVELVQTWTTAGQLAGQALLRESRFTSTVATAPTTAADAPGRHVVLQERSFIYRPDGHVAAVSDRLAGVCHFDLDPMGRVTCVRGRGRLEQYVYDQAGNATFAVAGADASVDGPRSYRGTRIRRAGADHFIHDRQGRLIIRTRKRQSSRNATWRYSWNALDQLTTAVTQGDVMVT
jgi:YD repeat-containing protein